MSNETTEVGTCAVGLHVGATPVSVHLLRNGSINNDLQVSFFSSIFNTLTCSALHDSIVMGKNCGRIL